MNNPTDLVSARQWHAGTRWLHRLMALGIVGQLVLSLIMAKPDHLDNANAVAKLAWEGHELLGLATVGIVVLHWLWLMLPMSDISIGKLFPWNVRSLQQVVADIIYTVKNRQLPAATADNQLASLIHGLGLLVATVMIVTGFALFVVMDFGAGAGSESFEFWAEIHETFGSLMWIYLIGHVVAAVWHEYRGERLIAAMFKL